MTGEPVLVDVLPNHRLDIEALRAYLRDRLPGFDADLTVRQFQGGQSNPTYHLQAGTHAYVLRKKPPGQLAPSAHAIEREYAVMSALAGTDVPVPGMRVLCEDTTVIGQAFLVMDHVPGRVFADRSLPGLPPADRAAAYDSAVHTLARLHQVDYRSVGLEGYGRPDGYAARQLSRWSRQYTAAKVEESPAVDNVIEWLGHHLPTDDRAVVVHGDTALGNFIFDLETPRAVALIDWELSTIGHPLADLAYFCLTYRLPVGDPRGLGDVDYRALGIPDEDAVKTAYEEAGGGPVTDWDFWVVLSMFRMTAIRVGVLRRALDGNAADAQGLEAGGRYRALADTMWEMVRGLDQPAPA